MPISTISGDWWVAKDEVRTIEDTEEVERGGRILGILRKMEVQTRQYRLITGGGDGEVRTPDWAKHWNDPIEGEPENSRDWLVGETAINYDIHTGKVTGTCSVVKMPEDWESVGVIKSRGKK